MADEYGGYGGGDFGSWDNQAWSPDSWQPSSWDQGEASGWGGGLPAPGPDWSNFSYDSPQTPAAPAWQSQSPGFQPGARTLPTIPAMPGPTETTQTERFIQNFLRESGGSVPDAYANIRGMRDLTGTRDPALANAEHAMFTESQPLRWPAFLAPGYTAAKALTQRLPAWAGNMPGLRDMYNASPASIEQLYWGMRPLWQSIR